MALKEDMGRFKMLNFQVPYRRPLQNSLGQLRSIPSFGNLAEAILLSCRSFSLVIAYHLTKNSKKFSVTVPLFLMLLQK